MGAAKLKSAGFTAVELKAGGYDGTKYDTKQMQEAGFTLDELLSAGFDRGHIVFAWNSTGVAGVKELKLKNFAPYEVCAMEGEFPMETLYRAGYKPQDLMSGSPGRPRDIVMDLAEKMGCVPDLAVGANAGWWCKETQSHPFEGRLQKKYNSKIETWTCPFCDRKAEA